MTFIEFLQGKKREMEKHSGESLFEELMLALVALHSAVLFLGVCWFNIELNKAMKVEHCRSCSRDGGIFLCVFLFFILKEKISELYRKRSETNQK